MELSVGPVAEEEWPAARALLHRAFANEPFTIAMYGEGLLARWGRSWDLYSSARSHDVGFALGARAGDVLVGLVQGSTAGHCRMCQVVSLEPRPEDPYLAIDWEFHQNVAQVHAPLGPHAWVEKAAVEPALQGLGVGRRLLEYAAATIEADGRTELVLECAPDRVSFYAGIGFEVLTTFPDPSGPDAFLMRRRLGVTALTADTRSGRRAPG